MKKDKLNFFQPKKEKNLGQWLMEQGISDVIYVKSKNKNKALKIHPLGALTVKSEGSEMAELHEMFDSGAVGFYDYKTSVKNPNLLKTALQYVQHFDGLIMTFPFEKSICQNGQMNEGEISTLYGLEGIPSK